MRWFCRLPLAEPFSGKQFLARHLKIDPVANPAGPGSSQVNWSVTQDGNPLMSWVESDELRYSIRKGTQWSAPRTIAAKRHFFHHPAELPEVITMPDGVDDGALDRDPGARRRARRSSYSFPRPGRREMDARPRWGTMTKAKCSTGWHPWLPNGDGKRRSSGSVR